MSRTEGLRANSSQVTLEGEPFHILGGSIHYFRVPRAYWGDRLLKMKACGVNALTTYVPWNLHEPDRGVFNFQDQLDLEAYISLAAKLWLWVIMDLGELPSYLHIINTQHSGKLQKEFTDPVSCFFDQLVPRLVPYQYSNGGTIIAVEVENEYGSYAKDNEYMPVVKEGLLSRGITELLLTSDYQDGL